MGGLWRHLLGALLCEDDGVYGVRSASGKGKGKGKETAAGVRVKEEPGTTSGLVVCEVIGNGASVSAP